MLSLLYLIPCALAFPAMDPWNDRWRQEEEHPERWRQQDNEQYYQLPWRRHHAYRRHWHQRMFDPDSYY